MLKVLSASEKPFLESALWAIAIYITHFLKEFKEVYDLWEVKYICAYLKFKTL
jgi:hypothetical protein